MKHKTLIAYLTFITLLSAILIIVMKSMGQKANYLAAVYMLGPAIAAIITRILFYKEKFNDSHLRVGRIRNYVKFWAIALGITFLSYVIYTILGAIRWDFTGSIFLAQLTGQFALAGQRIEDLPAGLTPQIMLVIYFFGGLTIFNILPGIITGFGEEFGWRGLMFPLMYKIKPWIAFIVGGLIWFLWHTPLLLILPTSQNLTITQTVINFVTLAIGSICTHTFFAYVYVKSENILVTSVAHITLDNAARSLAYYVIVKSQILANVGLSITMLIVVAILYYSKEWRVFENYYGKRDSEIYQVISHL